MRRGLQGMMSQEFAYEDFRRRINVQAVLDHYGAENGYEQTNTDGTVEVIHSCLLDRVEPHHANGDQNPSAAANLDKKLYVCYSYWGGDIFHLIMKMEGKDTLGEIIPLITPFLEGSTKDADTFVENLKAVFGRDAATVNPHHSAYSERVLIPWDTYHPYIESRGVDEDTARRLRIGYDPEANRITIPQWWGGVLVGWQKRSIPDGLGSWTATEQSTPKYKSSSGFPKGTTLYRYDQAQLSSSGRLIVVESPFSVIKAEALGLGINDPVVATFGAKITDAQIELMRSFRDVIVWMDDDEAGRRAERRVIEALGKHTCVRVVETDEGMDLGDYDDLRAVRFKIDFAAPGWLKLIEYKKEQAAWAISNRVSGR